MDNENINEMVIRHFYITYSFSDRRGSGIGYIIRNTEGFLNLESAIKSIEDDGSSNVLITNFIEIDSKDIDTFTKNNRGAVK